jgi:undecaprenyl-diphosphatase
MANHKSYNSLIVHMIRKLLEIDRNISTKLQLPREKSLLRSAAVFFAHSGDSWFWLAALFIIWLFTRGNWHKYSALFAGAIVIQASLVLAIKFLIKRQRPEGQWGEIYRKNDPNSFPSGHAVRAAMLAAFAWGFHLSPLNWILTIWAPLVSFARVSLGVHYIVDILFGWSIGLIIAVFFIQLTPFFVNLIPFAF